MGNNRKVWLACGAAVGLPLSGLAQDVKQVQVTEANGHVEIHVIGTNLPKPENVTWKKDVAYTLEWKAGLKSPGGRIRVDSGDVKSVWYGWFSAHPHAMRVQVQTKTDVHPELKQEEDGWLITIGDKAPAAVAKASKPAVKTSDELWATAAGEIPSAKPSKPLRLDPIAAKEPQFPIERSHLKVAVKAPETAASFVHLATPAPVLTQPVVVDTPAMKKWALVEQIDKTQIKKPVAAPQPLVAEAAHSVALAPAMPATQDQTGLRKVTLDCSNADLTQVLKGLAMQSGANIVIGPSVTGKVTADLHDVTIDQALKYVSYLTGVKYSKADGIYMFGSAPAEAVTERVQAENVVKVVPILSDSDQEVKSVLEAKFRGQNLEVLTPQEAKKTGTNPKDPNQSTQSVVTMEGGTKSLVMPESYVILIGPEDVVQQAQQVCRSVDAEIVRAHASYEKTDRIDRELFAYDVKFADPRSLREALISEIPGLRAVVAPNSVGTYGLYQEGRSKRQSNEDNSAATSTANSQSSQSQTQSSDTVSSVSTQQVDDSSLEAPFSKEEGVSVPMKLVLRGTHEQIQQALEYLRMLDTAPRQVALELRVMELTKQDALNAGIDWNILTGGAVKVINLNNAQSSANNSASISLSGKNFNGDVTVSLDALAQKNKLLARPNLVAMDGRQSEIFIGDIIRYVQSITQSQNGTTVTTGEVPVGVRLSVLPRIGADGNMTLDLRPRISLLTSFTAVTGGGELPQTSSRFAQSTISLQSGQTIAIGGLIQDQDVKTLSGIPILMNLPILGPLFRSTTITKNRSELVIFLTAKSLEGPVGSQALPMMKDSVFGTNGDKH